MVSHSHIGVLAFPFGTHAAPLIALVRRLASASSPGTQFSFFNSAVSNRVIFSGPVSDDNNIRVYDVSDGTPEGEAFTGSHFEAVGLFLKASPGNFERAIEEAEREAGLKISCLITDAFLWFACGLAEERSVPWVAFWTAGSCSLSAHAYTDEIIKTTSESTDAAENTEHDQKLSFIPGLEYLRLSDLPPEIFLDKNPTPLAITINNMVEKLPKSTAVVLNSFEEIDPVITTDLKSNKFNQFLSVGPSTLYSPSLPPTDDKTGCLPWLDGQVQPRSVVYISFGTVIVPPDHELAALAEALETCRFPFLWSLNERARKSLPDGFLERTGGYGKVVPWAPQTEVLGHGSVGAFVTHCGWNSILESIVGGVPMVCRPFFGDQRLNGGMVEGTWKIGVRVAGGAFGKDGTVEALRRALSDEGMRENVLRLRERARNAVGSDGSSSENFRKLLGIIGDPNNSQLVS